MINLKFGMHRNNNKYRIYINGKYLDQPFILSHMFEHFLYLLYDWKFLLDIEVKFML